MKFRIIIKKILELSFKTSLAYLVFFVSFFSIPFMQKIWRESGIREIAYGVPTSRFHTQTFAIINDAQIKIELADTQTKRIKGLSGRNYLDKDSGMFFVFDKSDLHGIWMKEMDFSIDIIWIADNMQVVHIERNAHPDSYPTIFKTPKPAKYVLEISAGMVQMYGIKIGDLVTLL